QAEDGIRDKLVTGVQTCALPISLDLKSGTLLASQDIDEIPLAQPALVGMALLEDLIDVLGGEQRAALEVEREHVAGTELALLHRSEERRVGRECRSSLSTYQQSR